MFTKKALLAFLRDEEGLTTVEYAIAGGLVGAGVIGAFALLGDEVFRVIDAIYQAISGIVIA
jgi:pilus assembly protein Flp/PilA